MAETTLAKEGTHHHTLSTPVISREEENIEQVITTIGQKLFETFVKDGIKSGKKAPDIFENYDDSEEVRFIFDRYDLPTINN